jgi:hypothetical protein
VRYLSFAVALAGLALMPVGRAASADGNNGDWGTIKGQVIFAGKAVPAPEPINPDKDQKHCLSKGPLFKQNWVVNPKTKGVRWVFVWLAPEPGGNAKLPIHPALQKFKPEVTIDQPCCQFEPHALCVRKGQKLLVENSAPVAHNVRWTGNPAVCGRGGNVVVPKKKSYTIENLSTNGKVKIPIVSVNCDFHKWMSAKVGVFDHPYFCLTDKDGKFVIKNAPAGKFRLKVWHEEVGWLGGAKGRDGVPITIKAGKTTKVDNLKLKPNK